MPTVVIRRTVRYRTKGYRLRNVRDYDKSARFHAPEFRATLAAMNEPTRAEVDAFTQPTVLEFGTSWCGYCRAAQSDIQAVMQKHPTVRHLKIEDGKDRPLGRSFRVKLWPTLVYLEAGVEKGRVVRPGSAAEIEAIFAS